MRRYTGKSVLLVQFYTEQRLCLLFLPLFCDPMNCSSPGSSVHGISQARILECVAISFSKGSSWPRDWTHVSHMVGRFFTTEPLGKPKTIYLTQANQKPMNPPSKEILKWTITKPSGKGKFDPVFLRLLVFTRCPGRGHSLWCQEVKRPLGSDRHSSAT